MSATVRLQARGGDLSVHVNQNIASLTIENAGELFTVSLPRDVLEDALQYLRNADTATS